jgi:hypothetical protein
MPLLSETRARVSVTRAEVREAMRRVRGEVTLAAASLGVSAWVLRKWLRETPAFRDIPRGKRGPKKKTGGTSNSVARNESAR